MSGRKFRKLLLVAAVVAVAYWIYKDRPTLSGMIDRITNPLLGSKAAVESSERNRVNSDAAATISEQTDTTVGSLKVGMRAPEVKEILGNPDSIEKDPENPDRSRWTYRRAGRVLVMDSDQRVVSIAIL
jgi:hypothetical protein